MRTLADVPVALGISCTLLGLALGYAAFRVWDWWVEHPGEHAPPRRGRSVRDTRARLRVRCSVTQWPGHAENIIAAARAFPGSNDVAPKDWPTPDRIPEQLPRRHASAAGKGR
jgi:hypothetical protein